MAKYSIEDTTLTNIADAIRAKKGSNSPIMAADFAAEISEIQTGSGGGTNEHDLEINWEKATTFIPKQGEIIIYDRETLEDGSTIPNTVVDENGASLLISGRTTPFDYERFKIGDGISKINDLPFYDKQLQEWINILAASVNNDMSIIYPKFDDIYNSLGYPNEGQSNAWAWINYILGEIGDVESLLAEL